VSAGLLSGAGSVGCSRSVVALVSRLSAMSRRMCEAGVGGFGEQHLDVFAVDVHGDGEVGGEHGVEEFVVVLGGDRRHGCRC
jgi:hypothetical protein